MIETLNNYILHISISTLIFSILLFIFNFIYFKKKMKNIIKNHIESQFEKNKEIQENFFKQINDTIKRFEEEIKDIFDKESNIDDIIKKVIKKSIDVEEQKLKLLDSIKQHQVTLNNTAVNFCFDESRVIDIIPEEYINKLIEKEKNK